MARGAYIGTSKEILNLFSFGSPEQKLTAVQTYACSWYGSNLWNLYGEAASKSFRAWKTTTKMAHSVPRQTRTFIVENYLDCGLPSVRQLILRRYVQFVQTLTTSANPVIWMLANLAVQTVRSTTGLNIKNIFDEFGLDPLNTDKRQFVTSKEIVPADKEENIELLNYLLYIRSSESDEEIISEINDLIFDICSQ